MNLDERRRNRYRLKKTAQKLLPAHRVNHCMNTPIHDIVKVFQSVESMKAFFGGLMVCGSVWTCPVCSAKISERRRIELLNLMNAHKAHGGKLAMLTLTFAHSKFDALKPNIQALTESLRRMRSGKRYTRMKEKYNILGLVRSFEITHGRNGWHPHFHLLIFYKSEHDIMYEMGNFYEMWNTATSAFSLKTNVKAFNLSNESVSSQYVAKWGLDYEMTKGQVKMSKSESGRTPFQILQDVTDLNDEQDKKLFQEYAVSMKGKSQLQYTAGLKKHYRLKEKSDLEIAEEQNERAQLLGIYDAIFHEKIKKYNIHHEALLYFEQFGFIDGYLKLNEYILHLENENQTKKDSVPNVQNRVHD